MVEVVEIVEMMDEGGDAIKVGGGHGSAGRQAEALVEKFLGDGATHSFATIENRLEVHGFP